MRDALALEHLDHRLRLARQHDLVVEPLQQQERPLEPIGEVHGRASAVDVLLLRIRPDHRVEVPRLELVGVEGERLRVGDAEVADARGERRRVEDERAEHDVAARASSFDPRPLRVGLPLGGEVPRRRDAVLPVDLAPAAVEEAAILAPEARAAAVVDVDDADAALREKLRVELELRRAVRGRPAVADHAERRELVLGPVPVDVPRRVVEGVCDAAVAGRELDRSRLRDRRGLELDVERAA